MAEAITRAGFGHRVFVASAGIRPGEQDPFVTAVMAEQGIDLSGRETRTIEQIDDTFFDLIVTLTPTAHHVALDHEHVEFGDVVYWPAGDPTVVTGSREQRMEAYREVRDRISARVNELFAGFGIEPVHKRDQSV